MENALFVGVLHIGVANVKKMKICTGILTDDRGIFIIKMVVPTSESGIIGILMFFMILLIGMVAVSIYYRNKYEQLKKEGILSQLNKTCWLNCLYL